MRGFFLKKNTSQGLFTTKLINNFIYLHNLLNRIWLIKEFY